MTGFTTLDAIVVLVYLLTAAWFGIRAAGIQRNSGDYFLGGRDMPWPAVLFSVVATETSTLTFISIPAVAYGGNLTFLQLTFGYILGRTIVAIWLLPAYFRGGLSTAYEYIGQRFGEGMRKVAGYTFIVTRVLADGVRLFATAIPLAVILRFAGAFSGWSDFGLYGVAILVIAFGTLIYTFFGGIKAVIWMDVVQMSVYLGGGLFAAVLILFHLPVSFSEAFNVLQDADKLRLFVGSSDASWRALLANPYLFWIALFGGAVFSIASHGTDQLIVQRLLTTRNLRDSQKALIWSGFLVCLQFAFFLGIGFLLYLFYGGISPADLGLQTADEVFAKFIVEEIPPGVKGLIIAALLAAAMSSLSSSLSALASVVTFDILKPRFGKNWSETEELWVSRSATVIWGVVLTGSALLFTGLQLSGEERPAIVELGLGIASYTYGGLLGLFLLGLLHKKPDSRDAAVGFFSGLVALLFMVEGPVADLLPVDPISIAWPLYTLVGGLIVILIANLSHKVRQI